MNHNVVQLSFLYRAPVEAHSRRYYLLARQVVDAPGLSWRTFLINEDKCEAVSVFAFESPKSLELFLKGPVLGDLMRHEDVEAVYVKTFQMVNEPVLHACNQGGRKAGTGAIQSSRSGLGQSDFCILVSNQDKGG